MMLELLCQRLGVEMRKFDPTPYLQEMGFDITISNPADVLANIVSRRKAVSRARVSSSGMNADVVFASESIYVEPEYQVSPLPPPTENMPTKPNLAIGN